MTREDRIYNETLKELEELRAAEEQLRGDNHLCRRCLEFSVPVINDALTADWAQARLRYVDQRAPIPDGCLQISDQHGTYSTKPYHFREQVLYPSRLVLEQDQLFEILTIVWDRDLLPALQKRVEEATTTFEKIRREYLAGKGEYPCHISLG